MEGQRPRGLKLREAARNLTSPPLPTRQSVLKQPAGPVFQVSSEAPLPHLEGMPTMASSFNDLGVASHRTGGSKALVPLPGPGKRIRPPSPTRLNPRRPPGHAHHHPASPPNCSPARCLQPENSPARQRAHRTQLTGAAQIPPGRRKPARCGRRLHVSPTNY